MQRLRFTLKDIICCTALLALLLGWYIDHKSLNSESSMLLSEIYKMKSQLRVLTTDGQAFIPEGMTAQFSTTGDVLDSNTGAGRREILTRLKRGDLDFRIMSADGRQQSGVENAAFTLETLSGANRFDADEQ